MPQFLCDEMQDCLKLYYSLKSDDRIFPVTKYYLNHEMERGCKASGVKKIRVHDLRHSHVSLLINMGYTALAIGKRVGHSAEKITYRYAHLFPSVQQDMAEQLDTILYPNISLMNVIKIFWKFVRKANVSGLVGLTWLQVIKDNYF